MLLIFKYLPPPKKIDLILLISLISIECSNSFIKAEHILLSSTDELSIK